jgi:hypothetical protein
MATEDSIDAPSIASRSESTTARGVGSSRERSLFKSDWEDNRLLSRLLQLIRGINLSKVFLVPDNGKNWSQTICQVKNNVRDLGEYIWPNMSKTTLVAEHSNHISIAEPSGGWNRPHQGSNLGQKRGSHSTGSKQQKSETMG